MLTFQPHDPGFKVFRVHGQARSTCLFPMVPLPGILPVLQGSDQQAMALLCAVSSVEDSWPLPLLVGKDLTISSRLKRHIWEKTVHDSASTNILC